MKKTEYYSLLISDIEKYNAWRKKNPTQKIYFRGANFRGANLKGADFEGANLEVSKLIGANLEGANLVGSNLRRAKLSKANLKDTKLLRAKLQWANLENAILVQANLEGANLNGAKLQGCILKNANLKGASLLNVNLSGASLEGANLEGVNFEGANLEGANLQGTILEATKFEPNTRSLQKIKRFNLHSRKQRIITSQTHLTDSDLSFSSTFFARTTDEPFDLNELISSFTLENPVFCKDISKNEIEIALSAQINEMFKPYRALNKEDGFEDFTQDLWNENFIIIERSPASSLSLKTITNLAPELIGTISTNPFESVTVIIVLSFGIIAFKTANGVGDGLGSLLKEKISQFGKDLKTNKGLQKGLQTELPKIKNKKKSKP